MIVEGPGGQLIAVEVKTGPTAALNPNQAWLLPQISQQGAVPVGKNAERARLTVGAQSNFDVAVMYLP
jgi:hypothetical protein